VTVPYSYGGSVQRTKAVSVAVGLVLGGTLVFTLVGLVMARPGAWRAFTGASFHSGASLGAVGASVWHGLSISTLNPWYWAFVALLTVLQWIWPARRDQRTLSVDMAVDAVWFVMGNAMQFTIVAITLGAVTVAYTELLGTWSLDLQPSFGFWGLAVFAFVVTDLLAWVSHWCHHKVGTLWRFHAVHHSQQRLNALSDNRTHVGEVIAAALIVFVPSQILGLNASTAAALAFIGLYYSAMLHSNIRTNLGPAKYVFMGPQPHRVHHSILPQHFEKNFGTVFSWWDYLAGTMYKGYDEYPRTGIKDMSFPLRDEKDLRPWKWIVIFAKQLVYPFQGIVAGALGRPRSSEASSSSVSGGDLATTAAKVPPADWYGDPVGDGLRFWDGSRWTEHTARATAPTRCASRLASTGALDHALRGGNTLLASERRSPRQYGGDPAATAPKVPPADWYGDPVGEGLRFWDGSTWTEHTARATVLV
jgi:sterol desaturase/sphingolipid hydroxylase (fatty acid hydroxylase superfamily)